MSHRYHRNNRNFKKNIEYTIPETDALAELVMLSVLILPVCEHPDNLITEIIISLRISVSFVEKPRQQAIVLLRYIGLIVWFFVYFT